MNRFAFAVSLGVLALIAQGCVTGGQTSASPEEVVRRFADMDLNGVRLSGSTYPRVEPLVTWQTQPDADPIYLVSGYTLGDAKVEGDRAEVPVKYEMISRIDAAWKERHPDMAQDLKDNEAVTFVLVRKNGKWRIEEPRLTPRVTPDALARVIRTWPQTGANGNDLRLQDTLRYLDSLKGQ